MSQRARLLTRSKRGSGGISIPTSSARVFRAAYDRWSEAADRLWGAETPGEFTDIGHACREAIQAFAA